MYDSLTQRAIAMYVVCKADRPLSLADINDRARELSGDQIVEAVQMWAPVVAMPDERFPA